MAGNKGESLTVTITITDEDGPAPLILDYKGSNLTPAATLIQTQAASAPAFTSVYTWTWTPQSTQPVTIR